MTTLAIVYVNALDKGNFRGMAEIALYAISFIAPKASEYCACVSESMPHDAIFVYP